MSGFDFLVIGAGSGGVRAARLAAEAGQKTGLIECAPLGGTCVNLGCVPKKLMMYAAQFADTTRLSRYSAWDVALGSHDWPEFLSKKNAEISRLNAAYGKRLEAAGVTLVTGYGQIVDQHTVSVKGREYTTDRLLIATGSTPTRPEVEGAEYGIVSDDIFHLPEMPKRIVIIGGGFIATEFACILHGLGVSVTQLYRGERILRGFDMPSRKLLVEQMRRRGIDVRHHAGLKRITKEKDGLYVAFKVNDDISEVVADQVLFATGRKANTAGLDTENIGLATDDRGFIAADAHFQTNVENVYALGDVVGRVSLTPVAINEARHLIDYLFGEGKIPAVDYAYVPQAVFASPALSRVGPTEEELTEAGIEFVSYSAQFKPMMYSFAPKETAEVNYYRLLIDKQTRRVLAAHLLGRNAPEIMQTLAVAIKAGATKDDFDAVVGIHPTEAEELVTMHTADK